MKNRVPPFETELEYKPVERDRLSEVIGGFSCSGAGCQIRDCFTDREHLISSNESLGATPLTEVEQLLRTHPDFIVSSICRWKHMRINVTWSRSEPISNDFGVGYLLASPVNLTPSKRKRLKEIRREK